MVQRNSSEYYNLRNKENENRCAETICSKRECSVTFSPEQRVPQDHPLRAIRKIADAVFVQLSPQFNKMYARTRRPSIAPEKLLGALLLQVLYSVPSERLLMEELDYNMLFRWFVGLNMDDGVVTV
jgi:transposase